MRIPARRLAGGLEDSCESFDRVPMFPFVTAFGRCSVALQLPSIPWNGQAHDGPARHAFLKQALQPAWSERALPWQIALVTSTWSSARRLSWLTKAVTSKAPQANDFKLEAWWSPNYSGTYELL